MASIEAGLVNHNTSAYAELALRSLFAHHPGRLDLALTVYDNGSNDAGLEALRRYLDGRRIPFVSSGFGLNTAHNSHGAVLDRFVGEHPACDYYLFLDSDTAFLQDGTIDTMRAELDADASAFGIGARMSWDGEHEMSPERIGANPDIYTARLHPCCALVRNTPEFRRVVAEVGLGCARMLRPDGEEYFDTFKLATRAMLTHGRRHIRSSAMVLHFFNVSYEAMAAKERRRDERLRALREMEAGRVV
ncbi:MAG TPA: hypothetical protein VGL23_21020 [Chloroflexota bacterium]